MPTAVWTRTGSNSPPTTPAAPDTTMLMTSAVPHSPLRSSESAPGNTLMRNGSNPVAVRTATRDIAEITV